MELNFPDIDAYLLTYPRSGKHWVDWYISNNTNLNILSSHYTKVQDDMNFEIISQTDWFKIQSDAMQNKKKIFSIARNPQESLTSIAVMEDFANIDFRYQQYLDHYEFILNNASIIFNFEDVVSNMERVAKYLCILFNADFDKKDAEFDSYKKWYKETQNEKKLLTSKDRPEYNDYLEKVSNMDLSKHIELYNAVKNKSVSWNSSQVG